MKNDNIIKIDENINVIIKGDIDNYLATQEHSLFSYIILLLCKIAFGYIPFAVSSFLFLLCCIFGIADARTIITASIILVSVLIIFIFGLFNVKKDFILTHITNIELFKDNIKNAKIYSYESTNDIVCLLYSYKYNNEDLFFPILLTKKVEITNKENNSINDIVVDYNDFTFTKFEAY